MNRVVFVFVTLLSLGLAACGSDDSSPLAPTPVSPEAAPLPGIDAATRPDHDAATSPDRDAAPDSGPVACNELQNLALPVSTEAVASAPPAPAGGAIADGTYVSTNATLYTGSGGATGPTSETTQMTLRFSGTRAENSREGKTHSATYSVEGTVLTTTETCPKKHVDTVGYTATTTSLAIFVPRAKGTLVITFTRM